MLSSLFSFIFYKISIFANFGSFFLRLIHLSRAFSFIFIIFKPSFQGILAFYRFFSVFFNFPELSFIGTEFHILSFLDLHELSRIIFLWDCPAFFSLAWPNFLLLLVFGFIELTLVTSLNLGILGITIHKFLQFWILIFTCVNHSEQLSELGLLELDFLASARLGSLLWHLLLQ